MPSLLDRPCFSFLLLSAWFVACGGDDGGGEASSTGAPVGSSADADTGEDETGDTSTGGGETGDTSTGAGETGDTSTGDVDACTCFSSPGPGEFELLCPAETMAKIDGACTGDDCTYDVTVRWSNRDPAPGSGYTLA